MNYFSEAPSPWAVSGEVVVEEEADRAEARAVKEETDRRKSL